MIAPIPARLGYRPALDGIRALAIALVVLHHTAALLVPSGDELFPGGFLGVNLFFVLSGFLITTLLLERRGDEPHPIRTFYARRALRLLPAVVGLLVAILVYALVADSGVSRALPSPRSCSPTRPTGPPWPASTCPRTSGTCGRWPSRSSSTSSGRCCCSPGFRPAARRQLLGLVLGLALLAALWRASLGTPDTTGCGSTSARTPSADSILVGAALALLPYERLLGAGERQRGPRRRRARSHAHRGGRRIPSSPAVRVLYLGGLPSWPSSRRC